MKTKVYVYTNELQVIDYEKVKNGLRMETTARESIANFLAQYPSFMVDAFIDTVAQSAVYSNEIHEDKEAMMQRIHADIMSLTTEHRRTQV